MKKIKRIRDWKIGRKLLATFMISAIIPMMGVQLFNTYMTRVSLEEKINSMMVNQLAQIAERVDLNLDLYMNVMNQMSSSSYLAENLKAFQSQDIGERALAQHAIYEQLQGYSEIRSISVVCPDGASVTYDWDSASMVENIWSDYIDMRQTAPYQNAWESNEAVITPTMCFKKGGEELRIFHISKKIYDLESVQEDPLAVIIISIDEGILNRLCQPNENGEDNQELAKHSINFIMDGSDSVISYPDSFYAGSVLEHPEDMETFVDMTGLLKNQKVSINTYQDERYGWVFYNAYDEEYMFQDVTKNIIRSMLVFVFTISGALWMISRMISSIRRSATDITEGISRVQEGDLDVVVPVYGEDEFGQIAHNLNDMTQKLKDLIAEVKQMADKKKDAEIVALEAQINPHFLYNTLDSINWIAISHGDYEVSEMLANLATIMRYSVENSNRMVTIREVTDWIRQYISLQQLRYRNSFSYEVSVEDGVQNIQIYKLLLQPFLENSIQHGLKNRQSGGILRVDILFSEGQKELIIIIEDNGAGMPQELVEKYNCRGEAVLETEGSLGLHNVFSRINMYYGERASWKISSMKNMGTVITLILPVERGN